MQAGGRRDEGQAERRKGKGRQGKEGGRGVKRHQ